MNKFKTALVPWFWYLYIMNFTDEAKNVELLKSGAASMQYCTLPDGWEEKKCLPQPESCFVRFMLQCRTSQK